MKKLIVAIGIASLALVSTHASAGGRYNHHHHRGHGGHSDAFVPFVIGAAITGAVIGSAINNQREPARVVEHRYYDPPPPPPPRVVKRYYYEAPPRYEERRYYYYDEESPQHDRNY